MSVASSADECCVLEREGGFHLDRMIILMVSTQCRELTWSIGIFQQHLIAGDRLSIAGPTARRSAVLIASLGPLMVGYSASGFRRVRS